MPPRFMNGFFQLGYVTCDLEKALEVYKTRFGVDKFMTFNTRDMNPDAEHHVKVGLAWTGDVMIELIEAAGDHPLYACAMPQNGFGIQLHHMGYLVDDEAGWREALAWLEEQRLPVVSHTKSGTMLELVYADGRDAVGHHLEVIWAFPEGRAFLESVPRN